MGSGAERRGFRSRATRIIERLWDRAVTTIADVRRIRWPELLAALALTIGAYSAPAVAAHHGVLGCVASRQLAGAVAEWGAAGRACGQPPSAMAFVGCSALTCACLLGLYLVAMSRVYARRARLVARWAAVGAVFALVTATASAVMAELAPGPAVQALALLAWVAVLPGALWAPFVAVTVATRAVMVGPRQRFRVTAGRGIQRYWPVEAEKSDTGPERIWALNYQVPPAGPTAGGTGICLSGGGIRAATFAMGAIQAFARGGLLDRADYLATVSGGGYFGGSYQMLRARSERAAAPVSRADAFAPGSPEEDHVRRHGKYIADGAVQWIAALGLVVRNVLLGLAVVMAVLVVVSGVLGWLYAQARPWSMGLFPDARCVDGTDGAPCPWAWPAYPFGTWLAVGGTLGVAFLVWVVSGVIRGRPGAESAPLAPSTDDASRRVRRALRTLLLDDREGGRLVGRIALQKVAGGLLGLGLAVLVVGVGIPALSRAAVVLGAGHGSTPPVIGLVTSIVTVWNMLGRKNIDRGSHGQSALTRLGCGAGFAVRALVSAAVVLGLLAVGLVIVGAGVARTVVDFMPDQRAAPQPVDVAWWLTSFLLLVVMAALFDQTRMSLHPFYKRRLATAFNLERGGDGAEEAPWGDLSTLSDLGAPDTAEAGRPRLQLILCAAANLSGQEIVPPGRRVTPLVFTSDWVGGPRLGYVATGTLETLVENRTYRSDVTVLAAMAMSGAAVASAMGRMSGPFDVLLALSNARLGVWVPNPRHLVTWFTEPAELTPPLDAGRQPLPRVRRLPYYARELLGNYSPDDRFVYVSDGGHYDNLGLLELLRRKCRTIYCVDASDDGAVAETLAEAATLAYEELGVRLTVDGVPLAPSHAHHGDTAHPQLRALKGRLSVRSVVIGRIHYPAVANVAAVGTLVVGKAVLTAELPFSVLAHAVSDARFPGDSTADQWFDAEQFDAYQALGRRVGAAMLDNVAATWTGAARNGHPDPQPAHRSPVEAH